MKTNQIKSPYDRPFGEAAEEFIFSVIYWVTLGIALYLFHVIYMYFNKDEFNKTEEVIEQTKE